MKVINTCLDCIYRKPGCHGSCETYLEAKKECEAERERVWQEKQKGKDYNQYKSGTIKKALRRRGDVK